MALSDTLRAAPGVRLPSGRMLTVVGLNVVGLAAYLYPFVFASVTEANNGWYLHGADGPLLFGLIAGLCLLLVVGELTGGGMNSRSLAALGVLAALAAVLRTVSLPAGANLYFFLVIVGAYTFGPRMGFLLGALSFFLSAVVTGGLGPWLPFQVFAAAWMGLTAGALGVLAREAGLRGRAELWLVVAFGAAWGLVYGAVINLWFWPFWAGGPDISYQPGIGLGESLRRYWNFYLLTSFGWDLLRSVCNALAIIAVGGPLLRALARFRDRFSWAD